MTSVGRCVADNEQELSALVGQLQGDRVPWTHMHEYVEERHTLPAADLDDGTLRYA